jgi:hypothetical protein
VNRRRTAGVEMEKNSKNSKNHEIEIDFGSNDLADTRQVKDINQFFKSLIDDERKCFFWIQQMIGGLVVVVVGEV